ncbi:MAG: MBL fold metallo-hydrolase [Pyrinomonadaceae bacterium]
MKVQLLPSTIDENGRSSSRQHLVTMIVDDLVAIDAGCLAFSCTDVQREQVRDIVLTHTHLDHIAGLPLFIDDLFATTQEPITIHATSEMIETLEQNIFNWAIYPRFSDLQNSHGNVVRYKEFASDSSFEIKHLTLQSIAVNHKVPSSGYIVSDGQSAFALTGDTAETDDFWAACNSTKGLKAVLVECAFPDEFGRLAAASYHLTPTKLNIELAKLRDRDYPVYVMNIKPMYREQVLAEIAAAELDNVQALEIGRVYDF